LKSTALPRLRPRCHIPSFIKTHSNIIMYSFHRIVFIVRSPYFWKHPTTREYTWVMWYCIFWKLRLAVENPFLNKIIILYSAKLQYVPWKFGCMLECCPACRSEAELQLLIKTGIFDRPTLSSAKWNALSALLGLAD
jgi:hypothetical protein